MTALKLKLFSGLIMTDMTCLSRVNKTELTADQKATLLNRNTAEILPYNDRTALIKPRKIKKEKYFTSDCDAEGTAHPDRRRHVGNRGVLERTTRRLTYACLKTGKYIVNLGPHTKQLCSRSFIQLICLIF